MKKCWKKISTIKPYYTMCFISFLIGSLFFIFSQADPFSFRYILLLLGYAPFLLFFTFSILHFIFKTELMQKLLVDFTIVLSAFLLFYYFLAFGMCIAIEGTTPITNAKYYKYKVKGEWLLQVFPKEIPSHVQNVQFAYQPGFLQGGAVVSLYYIDEHLDTETFQKNWEEKAIWIGHFDQNDSKKYRLSFYMTPVDENKINDFMIYLIEGRCDDSGYCNHGDFLFVAINPGTKEVIYKGEDW